MVLKKLLGTAALLFVLATGAFLVSEGMRSMGPKPPSHVIALPVPLPQQPGGKPQGADAEPTVESASAAPADGDAPEKGGDTALAVAPDNAGAGEGANAEEDAAPVAVAEADAREDVGDTAAAKAGEEKILVLILFLIQVPPRPR